MNDCHNKWQEEDHQYLASNGFFTSCLSMPTCLHNLVTVFVVVTFGNLFVVNNEYCYHEEHEAEIHAHEEEAAIQFVKGVFVNLSSATGAESFWNLLTQCCSDLLFYVLF